MTEAKSVQILIDQFRFGLPPLERSTGGDDFDEGIAE
jgi:hypothetical protein